MNGDLSHLNKFIQVVTGHSPAALGEVQQAGGGDRQSRHGYSE